MREEIKELLDASEMLWVVLANVSEGDWKKQSQEWQEAAERWRDNYLNIVTRYNKNNEIHAPADLGKSIV